MRNLKEVPISSAAQEFLAGNHEDTFALDHVTWLKKKKTSMETNNVFYFCQGHSAYTDGLGGSA